MFSSTYIVAISSKWIQAEFSFNEDSPKTLLDRTARNISPQPIVVYLWTRVYPFLRPAILKVAAGYYLGLAE